MDWRILLFAVRGLFEALIGLLASLFVRVQAEDVQISYIENERNTKIESKMDSYDVWRKFKPSAWARTSTAQTVFGNLNVKNKYPFTRSEQVIMADGVSIVLDWKESVDMAPDCPLVVCLHGIAGSSF